ncbi:DNA repair protein [Eremomyces bilateralis CBS 781.70]|uniref:DNA repair protein RAD14 n=1 Tax=Eremomyces bilateralis CBS 781.70 TaxID=1392243 RepID=A0A6G1G5B4_9PEZI|nr:DNA repair protein [Eremomyces bilateralis CBS 781.70]KAF1813208.1 DNA repair protein [Eremomyces bilateralis CBS 781.70]
MPTGPVTPEAVRRMEEARLKAKARRVEHDAATGLSGPPTAAGQKRSYASMATSSRPSVPGSAPTTAPGGIRPAPKDPHLHSSKKFLAQNYIEYDFSKMSDSRGGFLSAQDDPHNRAMQHPTNEPERPAHMTEAEWERHRLLQSLRKNRAGPFEPGISVLDRGTEHKKCQECESLELDWQLDDVFGVKVCKACKEKLGDKYSLLTKTECREDYLLTDEELRDENLLPRLERPNPHMPHWKPMMLFLRLQVEEYAFGPKRWGSQEGLDQEWERREADKKVRKDKKFREKLDDLKKKTRVEAYRRGKAAEMAARKRGDDDVQVRAGEFGQRVIRRGEKHEHEWGRPITDPGTGSVKKRCVECGMEVEELEL